MAFWIPPLWFGRNAGSGGSRLPALTGIRLGTPVHTRLCEVLSEELPGVAVWADRDLSPQGDIGDSIVVQNVGGEWLTHTNSWQQMTREIRILVFSATSDGAERLLDRVAIIIKRRHDAFNLIQAFNIAGGYEEEDEVYFRGLQATFRGRK